MMLSSRTLIRSHVDVTTTTPSNFGVGVAVVSVKGGGANEKGEFASD